MKTYLLIPVLILIAATAYPDNKISSTRVDTPNGYCEYIAYDDGSCVMIMHNLCPMCYGTGVCRACNGAGAIWGPAYGGMWYPCACAGTGKCTFCGGEGYRTVNSLMRQGTVTSIDQSGRVAVDAIGYVGSSGSASSARSSSNDYIEVIEFAPNYTGGDNSEYCPKCKKLMPRHSHIKKRY